MLLFLFSLGHALEEYALSRASKSIEALAELAPRTALVRRDGGEPVEVPVEQIAVADIIMIRPNSRIPSDGFVISGVSAVDQSAVTGESIPVEKEPVTDPERAMRTASHASVLPTPRRSAAGIGDGSATSNPSAAPAGPDRHRRTQPLDDNQHLLAVDLAGDPAQRSIKTFRRVREHRFLDYPACRGGDQR